DHETRRCHLSKIDVEEGEACCTVRGELAAATPRCCQQNARRYARISKALPRKLCAEKQTDRVAAKRVASSRDELMIEATRHCRHLLFQFIQMVEDCRHFGYTLAPEVRCTRSVVRQATYRRISMGGLDHGETAFSPELRQRGVSIFRRNIFGRSGPVRQQRDWQCVAASRCGQA